MAPPAAHLELILSVLAVAVALEGWLIADRSIAARPERPAQLAAALPGVYKLLANKYYVDEIYGAVFVKPLFAFSRYVLGWVVDIGILGGVSMAARRHRHIRRSRSSSAGSPAICAPTPRGSPPEQQPSCSSCCPAGTLPTCCRCFTACTILGMGH